MIKSIKGPRYEVVVPTSVEKNLERLNKKEVAAIIEKLEQLASSAVSLDIRKLAGFKSLYRLRYRCYRIIYEIYEDRLIIHVLAIGHRRDVYQSLHRLFNS